MGRSARIGGLKERRTKPDNSSRLPPGVVSVAMRNLRPLGDITRLPLLPTCRRPATRAESGMMMQLKAAAHESPRHANCPTPRVFAALDIADRLRGRCIGLHIPPAAGPSGRAADFGATRRSISQ